MELMLMYIIYMFFIFNIHFNLLMMLNLIIILFLLTKLTNLSWWYIDIYFGLNNYNYSLIILSLMIFSIILINLQDKWCKFIILMLFMFMIMNFCSMNLLLYYFLYESSLIFIYYLIIGWSNSAMKFMASYMLMFYTLLFSLPMLLIILVLLNSEYTLMFMILELKINNLSIYMFMYMMMGFLVKIPMYMFHSWLLKAHVEATFYGSMILASVMLKLGGYGLIRLMLMFKKYYNFKYFLVMWNILGMLVMSLLCMSQIDMKLLIAISSIVHMGLMISSMLLINNISLMGSYMLMLAHGYSSSGMFYLVNEIYKNTKTRLMFLNKSMINFMPTISMFWFLFCISNSAVPLTLNLFGEIFLLTGLVYCYKNFIFFMFFYCFLSFMYNIYLFSSINHGNEEIFKLMTYNGNMITYYSLIMHLMPIHLSFLFLMNI